MKTVAIIQARIGSTRLPAKVMADIAGKPMLARVVERAFRIAGIDEVVVATSRLPADDDVVTLCSAHGWPVIRGSETDVLERYVDAARTSSADVIVRITSDCPLLDPGVASRVLAELRARPELDYVSNTVQRTFPRGLDVEAIRREALERANRDATDSPSREHVTLHVYRHPETFMMSQIMDTEDHSALRWTVDTPEDLALVRAIYAQAGAEASYREILALCAAHPELASINAHIEQKPT